MGTDSKNKQPAAFSTEIIRLVLDNAEDVSEGKKESLSTGKISRDIYWESFLRYIKIKQKTIYGDFYTVWSVVYNLSTKLVNISIGRDYDKIYTFKLSE